MEKPEWRTLVGGSVIRSVLQGQENMTPREFEKYVSFVISQISCFENAEVQQNCRLPGIRQPGVYEIDITIRASLGDTVDLFMIVECKNWKKPVGRQIVQNLAQTKDALSAHKAAIASPLGFTKEAKTVAKALGIALWVVAETSSDLTVIMGFNGPSFDRFIRYYKHFTRLTKFGIRSDFIEKMQEYNEFELKSHDYESIGLRLAGYDYVKLSNLKKSKMDQFSSLPFELFSLPRVAGSATIGDSCVVGFDSSIAMTDIILSLLGSDMQRQDDNG